MPPDRDFINKIIIYMQYFYTDAETLKVHNKETGGPYLKDSRIRFVVDTVFFHQNTEDWDVSKYVLKYNAAKKDSELDLNAAESRTEKMYEKYALKNPVLNRTERDSSVNVFFLEVRGNYNKGMSYGLGSKRWLYVLGAYHNYSQPGEKDLWNSGMVLAHELGHCFGLDHPFDGQQCSDLPRVMRGQTNDMLDYWPNEGRAVTPCQMGIIQYNLAGHSNIADAVIHDWNEYHPDETINIDTADTVYWDGSRNVLGDIVVSDGSVWIVRGKIGFPPGAGLYIKPSSKVIVDGGALVSAYPKGGKWKGVILEKRKQFLFFGKKKQASISIFHNGLVE